VKREVALEFAHCNLMPSWKVVHMFMLVWPLTVLIRALDKLKARGPDLSDYIRLIG
jgi:hypothetical protein